MFNQENESTTLTRRAQYGLETKNKLVNRLREEVDLFMMSPECTPALCHLDALKEQLSFHYHRITQHVTSFADMRLRTLPIGGSPEQTLCISTWSQCVGYELICELLDSLNKEIEQLRTDCIYDAAQQDVVDLHKAEHAVGSVQSPRNRKYDDAMQQKKYPQGSTPSPSSRPYEPFELLHASSTDRLAGPSPRSSERVWSHDMLQIPGGIADNVRERPRHYEVEYSLFGNEDSEVWSCA